MTTTKQLYTEFMEFMDAKGIKYREFDRDDNIIYLTFGGDHDTFVLVDFDETDDDDADSVHFVSHGFARAAKKDIPAAMIIINQLNKRFRWVKFYIDDDGEISCDTDARVYAGSVGEECAKVAFVMSDIIDDALDELTDVAVINEEASRMLAMIALINSGELS